MTTTISDTPPSTPALGDFWWDSAGGQLYLWFNDETSTQWVPASNTFGSAGPPGPPGPTGPPGPQGPPGSLPYELGLSVSRVVNVQVAVQVDTVRLIQEIRDSQPVRRTPYRGSYQTAILAETSNRRRRTG